MTDQPFGDVSIPEGGQTQPYDAIRRVLQAHMAENPLITLLLQQKGEILQQVIQQPREQKMAESEPAKKDGTRLIVLEGVTVRGIRLQDALDLKVVAVRVPGVAEGDQRIYAYDPSDSSFYIMRAGSKSKLKKTRFISRKQLSAVQAVQEEEALEFSAQQTKEDVLAASGQAKDVSSTSTTESSPSTSRVQLKQSRSGTITLESGGGNLYVLNNFLIAVDGDNNFSYLRIPAPRIGGGDGGYLVVSAPNNSIPGARRDISEPVRVMRGVKAFSMGESGQVILKWQDGRTLTSGQSAPDDRRLSVDDLPILLEGTKIHKIYGPSKDVYLMIGRQYVAEFGIEVKTQPRPPATQEQTRRVEWIEKELKRLNSGFRKDDALFAAAGSEPATQVLVVRLERGVHLSIMGADLQRAIRSAQGLQGDAFAREVLRTCPYHLTAGREERWHSRQQTGNNVFLSGKYSRGGTIQLAKQLRYAGDLDWAYEFVRQNGFTI